MEELEALIEGAGKAKAFCEARGLEVWGVELQDFRLAGGRLASARKEGHEVESFGGGVHVVVEGTLAFVVVAN